jgi:hypothetical protein
MANQNFTDFILKTPASGDFLVGYNANGSREFKTTVNALVSSFATNTALNAASSVLLRTSVYQNASAAFASNTALNAASSVLLRTSVYQNASAAFASNTISITYAQLTALSTSNSFKIGQFYTLSDFVTEYMSNDMTNDYEWISPNNPDFITRNNGTPVAISAIAAKPEPLILQAIAPNKLSHIAYSLQYPQDIIHYDPNFTDLDVLGWPPSNPTQVLKYKAKGFITYRKDTIKNIECDYDWRNVRFKRWSPVMTATTSWGNSSPSTPVFPLAPLTEYFVGDVVTAGNDNTLVLYCIKRHTTSPDAVGSNYDSKNWVLFFSTDGLMHQPALTRPLYGRLSGNEKLFLGGYGQANYYYTFSNSDGTLATNSLTSGNAAAITNIKIKSRTPTTFQNLYSERMSNLVLFRRNTGASFRHLTFEDTTYTTFYGGFTKSQCSFKELYHVYVGGGFFDSKLFQINYGQPVATYFTGTTKRAYDIFNILMCVIGENTDLKISNSYGSVFSRSLNNSIFDDCTNCAFAHNSENNPRNFVSAGTVIKNKNQLGYLVSNPPGGIVNKSRPLYFSPSLKNGISFDRQAPEVNITLGSSKIPHYEYYDDNDNLVRESIYGTTPLLYKHADTSITTRLAEVTASDFKNIYTTQNHTLSTYVRNPNCWCYDLADKMSCISPWNNAVGSPGGTTGGGVLITPRHVYMTTHFQLSAGTIIRFVSQNNQIVDRTIVETYSHPLYNPSTANFDITVGLLDTAVPSSIIPARVVPLNFHDYFIQQLIPLNGLWTVAFPAAGSLYTDQEEKALVIDHFMSSTAFHEFSAPTNTLKVSAYEPIITGDSGNPVFYIINNELVLLGAWAAVRPNGDAIASEYNIPIDRNGFTRSPLLQEMIDTVDANYGISTGYKLNTVTLSSFVKFTVDDPISTSSTTGSAIYVSYSIPLNVSVLDGKYTISQFGTNNPSLTCYRGTNYDFIINTSSHPFALRTNLNNTSTVVLSTFNNDPLNGRGNGNVIYFTPGNDTPNIIYYQCTVHPSMSGAIYIKEYSL